MKRATRPIALWLLTLVSLTAPAAAAYEETTVADAGILAGVVRFAGTPPKLEPLHVNKNRDVCGEQKPSEALVVGPDRGVKGAVVRIEGIARGKKNQAEIVLDNRQCVFVPHVAAVMAGTRGRVKSSDPILHNTHGFMGRATVFNLALPRKGDEIDITKKIAKPGVVRVLCDAHPHMTGWLVVHDSPYVATTDERGAFRIDGIPPGTYTVTLWHEGFRQKGTDKDGRPLYEDPRTVTRQIAIGPRATAPLELEIR